MFEKRVSTEKLVHFPAPATRINTLFCLMKQYGCFHPYLHPVPSAYNEHVLPIRYPRGFIRFLIFHQSPFDDLNDFLTPVSRSRIGETNTVFYFVGMTPAQKYTLSTSVFYCILLPLVPVADRYSPSGPCTLGLGFLLLLLTPVMAVFGFVVSFVGRARGNRAFTGPTLINLIVLVGFVVLLYSGRI